MSDFIDIYNDINKLSYKNNINLVLSSPIISDYH